MWSHGIIGPFFEDEQGETVTVNSERYVLMLDTMFLLLIQNREEFAAGNLWLMQDGAPAHIGARGCSGTL